MPRSCQASLLIALATFITVPVQFGWGQDCNSPCQSSCNTQSAFHSICNAPAQCNRSWIQLEYMSLYSDGYHVPELVAQSDAGTPRETVGHLDDPATQSIYGNQDISDGSFSAFRIGFGRWLDNCGNLAVSGSAFFANNDSDVRFPNNADTIISRPFFNTDPEVAGYDSELVNLPGVVNGTIGVSADTDVFSFDLGLRKKLVCLPDACSATAHRVDFTFGYRGFRVNDAIAITETLVSDDVTGLLAVGTQFDVLDSFETKNRFNGIEIGLLHEWQRQRWTFNVMGKAAFGNIHQTATISGLTTTTVPGFGSNTVQYGVLAAPSNIGTYSKDEFGVLTEARLGLGYFVSSRCKINLGYTFMSLSDAVRAGSLVDTNLNATQIDPLTPNTDPSDPSFVWDSQAVLLHGFRVGCEFHF